VTASSGLRFIEENGWPRPLSGKLVDINEEDDFPDALEHVRERIRNFYSKYSSKADQNLLKREVTEELRHKKLLDRDLPDELFNEVILTIKKEAIYIHNLLPTIVAGKDTALREDFLENSGLDRFYVEELEREYYDLNDLNMEGLYQIRKGFN
jgi:uncharacterized protein (TIGR04442 family)